MSITTTEQALDAALNDLALGLQKNMHAIITKRVTDLEVEKYRAQIEPIIKEEVEKLSFDAIYRYFEYHKLGANVSVVFKDAGGVKV